MEILEVRLLIVVTMVILMAIFLAYSYDRDQAMQNKRLIRIPVRTRDQRGRTPLPEEEPNEMTPSIFYIAFLLVGYLIAMFLLAG
jgi:hypothetical protein